MQTLHSKEFGELQFVRTWAGGTDGRSVHIGELPTGGYAQVSGHAVESEEQLRLVMPHGPHLLKALDWWQHRDDEEPEEEPPAVIWRRGVLIYAESGAELTSHAEIIQAFPDESPFQMAALQWFGQRQASRQAQLERQAGNGMVGHTGATKPPRASSPSKRSHKKKAPASPRRHVAVTGQPPTVEGHANGHV